MQRVLKASQKQLVESPHFQYGSATFALITQQQKVPKLHGFDTLFRMCESKSSKLHNLMSLLHNCTLIKDTLQKLVTPLGQFLVTYAAPGPTIDDPKYVVFVMSLYDIGKRLFRLLSRSSFLPFMSFWLRCCWSSNYNLNPKVNISIKCASIEWTNVPVSCYEVLLWFDEVLALITQIGHSKYSLDQWYKYWMLKFVLIKAYIPIFDYICVHIQSKITNFTE